MVIISPISKVTLLLLIVILGPSDATVYCSPSPVNIVCFPVAFGVRYTKMPL